MIHVYKFDDRAKTPQRNISTDGGLDLFALEDIFLEKGTTVKVRTGVAVEIPIGYAGQIADRSSMASKGVMVSGGVIDSAFSGEISVILNNFSNTSDTRYPSDRDIYLPGYKIKAGDKIAQLLIYQVNTTGVCVVSELWTSERGDKGFGSSGR